MFEDLPRYHAPITGLFPAPAGVVAGYDLLTARAHLFEEGPGAKTGGAV